MNADKPQKGAPAAGQGGFGRGGSGFTWRYAVAIAVGLVAA